VNSAFAALVASRSRKNRETPNRRLDHFFVTVNQNIRGFVLAGGASRRFGRDKALVEFEGEPLIGRLSKILQVATAGSISIIGDADKYGHIGVECVPDRWPGEGPLGGIVTALMAISAAEADTANVIKSEPTSWSLVVGCDMPFLTVDWLQHLASRAIASKAEVVVPESTYGLEPLCACWRVSAAPLLTRAFDNGVRRVTDAMKQLRMEVLDAADWKRFDNLNRLFWNMNTPADHEEAIRMLKTEHP
jgi:molybdopterin-guanine dinucleotide biosynthesis protein A